MEIASRLKYIDAMRGLMMVLVVFGHQLFFNQDVWGERSVVTQIMADFRMPVFFFVSGYFVYRKSSDWTSSLVSQTMLRKFQAQVIGTFVFCSLYILLTQNDYSLYNIWCQLDKYWFTACLFRLFCIYFFFSILFRRLRARYLIAVLLAISAIGIITNHVIPESRIYSIFVGHKSLYFLQFYTLGIIVKVVGIEKALSIVLTRKWAWISGVAFLFFATLYYFPTSIADFLDSHYFWNFVYKKELVRYLGLIAVFSVFYINR